MAKKELKPEELWAAFIMRVKTSSGEKISAYVRRKFSDDDVDDADPGHYIGTTAVSDVPMIFDKDPESETFGDRIPDPDGEPQGLGKIKFTDLFNKENIAKYKKLVGNTVAGNTQLIYKFRDRSYSTDDEEEFWKTPIDEIKKIYTNKKQIVQLENPPK